MKTSVETLDPVKVKLTVEVEPKRVKQAFDKAARELAKQVNVPGFRPGKAPRRLIEQRFGDGVIAQQALEASLTDYYLEAVQSEELVPVGQPEVDVESFTEADGCTFTATIEIRPEVDLPDHTGISVSFPQWDVDDAKVDEQLEQMRERFAEVEVVERAAKKGDLVTLDLAVAVDGTELESARVEDALYEIGSAGVTPKLDEEAVGKAAGDEFTYEDALPEGYPEHGGEDATFTVTVKDVREKQLPALDDDFAMTASEFDSIQELRKDIRDALLKRSILQAQHDLRGQTLEAYLATVEVPLPPAMVEADAEQRIHQLEHQAERFGAEVEQLLELEGTTREEFESNAREQAEGTVKAQLVLDQLASKLEVPVESADIDREIVRHAQTNEMPPQEIARIIQQQGSLPALLGDIMRRKAIDAIVAAAEVDGAPSQAVLEDVGLTVVDGLIVEAPPEVVDVPQPEAPVEEPAEAPVEQDAEGSSEEE
ncbi:trigger factor [Nitriliruptor alkaliphilus]|uniref:trigger factor n=1 Tax=Nitriliruptor alkaliphilus TaxID=427918 RepID=UPI000696CADC|nr:trigger factor [Nitriliruptor alkaliphilus]